MLDDTKLAVPALAVPGDGLQALVRTAVRAAIEAAVEVELTQALGRAAWERAATATGYRHGTIDRTVVTNAGPVALTLPRGRLAQPDGTTQEWRSAVVPLCVAALALYWVYACRGFALITGPSERQVRSIVMGEVSRFFARAHNLPGQLFEMMLRVPGAEAQGILAFTTNDASRLSGFHAPRLAIFATESQGIDAMVWEGIHANITGAESRVLAVGNPLANSGRFYEACLSPGWRSIKISALQCPNVTGERVIPGAVGQAFIDRMAAEYGVGSSVYRSRVLAEFPDDAAESLVKRAWLDAAADRFESGAMKSQMVGQITAGLDVARYGADATVLAIRQGPVVSELVVWNQADTVETAGRCETELFTRGIALRYRQRLGVRESDDAPAFHGAAPLGVLYVDSTGVGAGVMDVLKHRGCNVREFHASSSAPGAESDRMLNRRAFSFWALRWLLENNKIALPRDPKLFDELAALQWSVNLQGRIKIESKDDVRVRLGRSTDRADAVAQCCEGLYRPELYEWRTGRYAA